MMTAIILGLLALSVLTLLAALTFLYRWIVRSRVFPQLPKLWKTDRLRFGVSAAAFVVFMLAFIAVGMIGGGGDPDSGDPTTPAGQRPTGPSFDQPAAPPRPPAPLQPAEQPQSAEQAQAQPAAQAQLEPQPPTPNPAPEPAPPALPDPDADAPAAPAPTAQEPSAQPQALTGSYSAGPKEAAPAPEAGAQTQPQPEAAQVSPLPARPLVQTPEPPPEPKAKPKPEPKAKPKARPKAKPKAQPELDQTAGLPGGKVYGVCLASFRKKSSAANIADDLKKQGYTTRIIPAKVKGQRWYRVCVGTFTSLAKAKAQAQRLHDKTKYKSSFIARIK